MLISHLFFFSSVYSSRFFSNMLKTFHISKCLNCFVSSIDLSLVHQKQLPFPCQIINENFALLGESVPLPLLNFFFLEPFCANLNSVLSQNCQLWNEHPSAFSRRQYLFLMSLILSLFSCPNKIHFKFFTHF